MITSERQIISIYGLVFFVEGIWSLLENYQALYIVYMMLFGGVLLSNPLMALGYSLQLLLILFVPLLKIVSGVKAMELGKRKRVKGLELILKILIVLDAIRALTFLSADLALAVPVAYIVVDIVMLWYFLSLVKRNNY